MPSTVKWENGRNYTNILTYKKRQEYCSGPDSLLSLYNLIAISIRTLPKNGVFLKEELVLMDKGVVQKRDEFLEPDQRETLEVGIITN